MGNSLIGKPAAQDLRTHQYKAVTIGGVVAATNTAAMGIQQNKPDNTEDLSILIAGRSRFRAGGAVTAGGAIKVVTSGWFEACASGDLACGKAFEAVSSGAIGEGHFDFSMSRSNPGA